MATKDRFEIVGNLWLICQEGGFAAAAFEVDGRDLDELVMKHFDASRIMPTGNSHIGQVRITIEPVKG